MDKSGHNWSVPVVVEDIPDAGLRVAIEAPAEAREAVAQAAGLRSLPKFAAVFDLERHGDGVRVSGHVTAKVGQFCSVTLEPMESDLDETVDLVFVPGASTAATKSKKAKDEPPEPLVDGRIDLGAVATEFLMLGINPYPRKADASFQPPKAEEPGSNPFAVLEALKTKSGRKA